MNKTYEIILELSPTEKMTFNKLYTSSGAMNKIDRIGKQLGIKTRKVARELKWDLLNIKQNNQYPRFIIIDIWTKTEILGQK